MCVYLYIDTLYISTNFLPKDNSVSHEHYICSRPHKEKNKQVKVSSQLQSLHGCCLFLNIYGFRCDIESFQSENQNEL